MKRLFAAAALLILLVGICIAGKLTVINICEHSETLLKESFEAAEDEDWQNARLAAERLSRYINSKHAALSAFSNKGEIDELMLCCDLLLEASEKQDRQEFSRQRRTAKHLLYMLQKNQRLNEESFI